MENLLTAEYAGDARSTATKIRGRIGLIEAGTGNIVGEANLITSAKSLTKPIHIWFMDNVIRYDKPIPYKHPRGAVIWVKLQPDTKET